MLAAISKGYLFLMPFFSLLLHLLNSRVVLWIAKARLDTRAGVFFELRHFEVDLFADTLHLLLPICSLLPFLLK